MITLKELLHSIKDEEKNGLISIDDWKWPDVDHLITMGFEFNDDYNMSTNREPKIKIYKKKEKDGSEKGEEFFFIEEPDRETKRFKTFNDVIDYFDSYAQPVLDKNK